MDKRIEIYNDGEQKVEIDAIYDWALKKCTTQFFYLDELQYSTLVDYSLTIINDDYVSLNKKDVSVAKNICMLTSNYEINFQDEYAVFNEIANYICELNKLNDEDIDDINQIFEEERIFCYNFERRIFDVDGFFCNFNRKKVRILYFRFEDRASLQLEILSLFNDNNYDDDEEDEEDYIDEYEDDEDDYIDDEDYIDNDDEMED